MTKMLSSIFLVSLALSLPCLAQDFPQEQVNQVGGQIEQARIGSARSEIRKAIESQKRITTIWENAMVEAEKAKTSPAAMEAASEEAVVKAQFDNLELALDNAALTAQALARRLDALSADQRELLKPDYGSWVASIADNIKAMETLVRVYGAEVEKHKLSPELQKYMNRPELQAKIKNNLDAICATVEKLKDVYGLDFVKPLVVPIAKFFVRWLMN